MVVTSVPGTAAGPAVLTGGTGSDGTSGCGVAVDVPLGEEEARALARVVAALADPVRLRLVALLAAAPSGEVCVCDVVGPLGRSQPTVSHHFKVLGEAGLVRGDRRGKWVWYSLDAGRLDELAGAVASIGRGWPGGPA